MNFSKLDMDLLNTIAELKGMPSGALNIRKDGQAVVRQSSSNISIIPLEEKPGIRVEIKPGTRGETVHIPVILTKSGLTDLVYNTFVVGADSDITIIAGCGIHNDSHADSSHQGIHEILVGKGARMKYVEKHYGEGSGQGKRILHPTTIITVEEGGHAELELVQIRGVDDTHRLSKASVKTGASLKFVERVMTHDEQKASSEIDVNIEGRGATAQVFSRSVAKDKSLQIFQAVLRGQTECMGHVECDAIIMDHARIQALPQLVAEDSNAVLTHEAAIGKIAGEQLIKLMSLGLNEAEAVNTILEGFLR